MPAPPRAALTNPTQPQSRMVVGPEASGWGAERRGMPAAPAPGKHRARTSRHRCALRHVNSSSSSGGRGRTGMSRGQAASTHLTSAR